MTCQSAQAAITTATTAHFVGAKVDLRATVTAHSVQLATVTHAHRVTVTDLNVQAKAVVLAAQVATATADLLATATAHNALAATVIPVVATVIPVVATAAQRLAKTVAVAAGHVKRVTAQSGNNW